MTGHRRPSIALLIKDNEEYTQLYEEAKEADIPGRSSMSKDELAEALNK